MVGYKVGVLHNFGLGVVDGGPAHEAVRVFWRRIVNDHIEG